MTKNKCKHSWCNNPTYKQLCKCILHCEKDKQYFDDIKFDSEFKEALIQDIVNQRRKQILELKHLTTQDFAKFLNQKDIDEKSTLYKHYSLLVNDKLIVLDHIIFPSRVDISESMFEVELEDIEPPLYLDVLKKFGRSKFHFCEFYINQLENQGKECSFEYCTFYSNWKFKDYIASNTLSMNNCLYEECIFKNGVSSIVAITNTILSSIQFANCKIKNLTVNDVIFKKPIFNNSESFRGKIESLDFHNCEVKDKFIFNRYDIQYIRLQDTVFKNKFEFKDNEKVECVIINTNFEGLVDFYKTNFKDFFVQKSIFNEFSGFEMCTFGSSDFVNPIQFQHVTFLNFINFRDAKFYAGLDMRDANLKEYPNFLDAYINPKNTDKETFRIIKYSFDKVGNITEGNKYFSYEMDKERRETYFWHDPDKKIVLWFNYLISNFGQSFMLPLLWIFILGILHHFVNYWIDTYKIIDYFPKYHLGIESIVHDLNSFSKNILPFKRFLPEGKEFISLLFLIGYSTLIYHFIVAVKRMTKR